MKDDFIHIPLKGKRGKRIRFNDQRGPWLDHKLRISAEERQRQQIELRRKYTEANDFPQFDQSSATIARAMIMDHYRGIF